MYLYIEVFFMLCGISQFKKLSLTLLLWFKKNNTNACTVNDYGVIDVRFKNSRDHPMNMKHACIVNIQ